MAPDSRPDSRPDPRPDPPPDPAGSERRLEGSAWQGGIHRHARVAGGKHHTDLILWAALGRMTGHLSPAALGMAWFDWTSHLMMSPDKQQELFTDAVLGWQRWWTYVTDPSHHGADPVRPLAQDKRFSDPAWNAWPWHQLSQAFLMGQQWWHRATSTVRGVAPHHADVVTFVARQLLDGVAPSNFVSTNPVVQQATLASGGMNLVRGSLRAMRDAHDALVGRVRPSGYRPGIEVAVTPGKVVMANRLVELLRYDPVTPTVHATPLLIVPAWIMKYYILDLSPQNSLVRYLVEHGHTVFMVSWKNPQAEDRDLTMDDYRQLGIMSAIDAILAQTGARQVNAAGYCLGGTLLAIAAAAMARDHDHRLASISLLAAQVDFTESGELSLFIDDSQVSFLEAAMWQQGYLDTRQMAGAFQLLRSNDLVWSRRLRHYLLDLPDQETDLMSWNADATRMPYRMHAEYLHRLFLRNSLAGARYLVGGRPVSLSDIDVPVCAVGTLTDHVAPWRSVYKIIPLTDTEITFILTSGGHNAGVVSPPGSVRRSYQVAVHGHDSPYVDPDSWQARVPQVNGSWWPAWEGWLARHAGAQVAPPALPADAPPAPGNYVLQA